MITHHIETQTRLRCSQPDTTVISVPHCPLVAVGSDTNALRSGSMGTLWHRYRKRAGTAALPLWYGLAGLSGAAWESSPAAELQNQCLLT